MSAERRPSLDPERVATGVPNLDRVLGGGLLRGATAMLMGAPGTGKTILAQQIAFHRAARGEGTLCLTGYSEPHDKLLVHLRAFTFFEPAYVGRLVHYASLPDLLRQGSEETEDAIVATARKFDVSQVVLDGFRSMRRLLLDEAATARFLYSLGAKLALLGKSTLVTVEGDPGERARYPELTVCDVILALRREPIGSRFRRLLDVVKVRGAAPIEGLHPFTIDEHGLTVYPRFESTVPAGETGWTNDRVALGLPDVDRLLGGGPAVGTCTLLAGSVGIGKTLLGLHFAAEGVRRTEPVLFLGFHESAQQLHEQGAAFGLELRAAEARGLLRLLPLPAYDLEADRIAALLRDDVEARGVRRLVIDTVGELERSVADRARVPEFLAALVRYLRARRVTTVLTLDLPTIIGPALDVGATPLGVVAENLVLMRQAEYLGRLHNVLSVLKMRFSSFDRTLHEFTITAGRGIELVGPAPPAVGLLTGVARPLEDLPPQAASMHTEESRGDDPDR
jgi:circadian clock protein KaiC